MEYHYGQALFRRIWICMCVTFNEKLRVEDLVGAEHWHLSQGDGESELDL